MNRLLRHNFWIVKLSGLIVVMALVANTTTTLLALYLMSNVEVVAPNQGSDDSDEEPVVAKASAVNDRARRVQRAADRILGRNAFCPTCGPAPDPDADPAVAQTQDADTGLAGAQRSALPLVVAATMESDDPARSLATLIDTQRGIGGLYGVGDALGAQVEIVHVATGVVHIRNAGRLEYIPFDAGPPPKAPTKAAQTKTPSKPKAPSKRMIPGADEAIQCNAAGDCTVDRAFVEQLIAKPALLMGQGGVSPTTTKSGDPGFRLRGVRKGTLPQLLGLKNGDVLTEVGGNALTMDVVPTLIGKLRHASHIEVTVNRRGERLTRQLDIRS
ncbi:MAG: hypothetical protein K0V04_41490 [Deltaproteobacteria bacterium]|nr:hypothetical protein [Deltaproteobacteria bacterium]